MRIYDISGTGFAKQFANLLAVAFAQWLNSHANQDPREIRLLAAITPDLANDRSAGADWCRLALKYP